MPINPFNQAVENENKRNSLRRLYVPIQAGNIRSMSGNTFGKLFTVTTFGESHGPAIGVIVDGCPPAIKLSERTKSVRLD